MSAYTNCGDTPAKHTKASSTGSREVFTQFDRQSLCQLALAPMLFILSDFIKFTSDSHWRSTRKDGQIREQHTEKWELGLGQDCPTRLKPRVPGASVRRTPQRSCHRTHRRGRLRRCAP